MFSKYKMTEMCLGNGLFSRGYALVNYHPYELLFELVIQRSRAPSAFPAHEQRILYTKITNWLSKFLFLLLCNKLSVIDSYWIYLKVFFFFLRQIILWFDLRNCFQRPIRSCFFLTPLFFMLFRSIQRMEANINP